MIQLNYLPSDTGYVVDSTGIVYSLKRDSKLKIMPWSLSTWGYPQVTLSTKGKQRTARVHVLVAEAFLGLRPTGFHVCHNDGDKFNNRTNNLRYDTAKSNSDDATKHGTRKVLLGEKNGFSKLTSENVADIRKLYSTGNYTQQEIATMFEISREHVRDIYKRKVWKHIK